MERRDFIKSCGYACVGGTALITILNSCKSTQTVNGLIMDSDIVINISDFEINNNKKNKQIREFIIVQNDALKFPICVYRINETTFSALYLECPHQGAELQVFGDKLHCPAHGAEFDNHGKVMSGPAETNLRSFPIKIENKQIKISLK